MISMVSVPSFGDSFFIIKDNAEMQEAVQSFPSPHSGILFLCDTCGNGTSLRKDLVSVPSFGDSFFITSNFVRITRKFTKVSVPSFGDSFFIKYTYRRIGS